MTRVRMTRFRTVIAMAAVLATSSVFAAVPAGAPAGSTGLCKDGTYSSNETKKGACAGHKGVKDWFEAEASTPKAPAAPMAAAPAKVNATTPATSMTKAPAPAPTSMTPAAGGGAGQVWVNTASKVYHCVGTKYYGKTKAGEYMTEAAAKTAGAHADHGKACS